MPITPIVAQHVTRFAQYDGTNSADLVTWCGDNMPGYAVAVDSESGGTLVISFADFEHTEYATLATGDYIMAGSTGASSAGEFAGNWREVIEP